MAQPSPTSVGVAAIIARTAFNSDIFEGWVMLVAAFFVVSMIWFMQKTARGMKGDIETKIASLTGTNTEKKRLPPGPLLFRLPPRPA